MTCTIDWLPWRLISSHVFGVGLACLNRRLDVDEFSAKPASRIWPHPAALQIIRLFTGFTDRFISFFDHRAFSAAAFVS
jgi:hypothetical protein